MVIDVHCHIGYSAKRVDASIERFSFERDGAAAHPGFDSYFSPNLMHRPVWFFIKRFLGIDTRLTAGETLDLAIEAVNQKHFDRAVSVDRLVLLAFDEYHDDSGRAIGPATKTVKPGSDLFVSNSLLRSICQSRPERYLFGASLHPYRPNALTHLEEVAAAGAVLIKWLPIHQNIRAEDPRTIAFLRKAAECKVPVLIHYGGEMSLSRQHLEFESPLPMLAVLRKLYRQGDMPTVIVAHAATPSFSWQNPTGHRALMDAVIGELGDAPLFADISALAAFGRTAWLKRLAPRKELHRKLLWGTDFPIPVRIAPFWRQLDRQTRGRIAKLPSWIEQDYQLKREIGFSECVFTQLGGLLPPR